MNKSKAIKNSVLYYELNMINQLLKLNLINIEEHQKIADIAVNASEKNLLLI